MEDTKKIPPLSILSSSPPIPEKKIRQDFDIDEKSKRTVGLAETTLTVSETDDSPSIRYPALKVGLQAAYRNFSTLMMPLSERPFPIQAVSLTINTKILQTTKERAWTLPIDSDEKERKSKKTDNKVSQRIDLEFGQEQLDREEAWHKIEKPILVEDIFKPIINVPEKNTSEIEHKKIIRPLVVSDHPIKRVLIEGRAGVGKSTLVQFIAWQWATQSLYSTDYDYLLWVPLRQWLKASGSRFSTLSKTLAAFLHQRYFPTETSNELLIELEAILSCDTNRTLLVLDGYDEVAYHLHHPDSAYGQLLQQALQFKQIIVTTRDYQLPPTDIIFDSHLVNIGFTNKQIEHYVRHYRDWLETASKSDHKSLSHATESKSESSTSATLLAALRSNPRLWILAHVPLNLALICEAYWQTLITAQIGHMVLGNLTLTGLYQQVLQCFLRRQLQKQDKNPTLYDMETLKNHFIIEWDSLSTLAWEGFKQGELILSPKIQENLLATLRIRYPKQYKNGELEIFLERAFNLGLLRSEHIENHNLINQPHYFIHLTFQEYMAAHYVADTLQGYRGEKLYQEILTWLGQHKYDPHAAVLLGFAAGISTQPGYDQAMSAFWYALLSPPHDLIGFSHLRLILRCLEEARYDRRIPARAQLLDEIEQWGKSLLNPKIHTYEESTTFFYNSRYFLPSFWSLLRPYPQIWEKTKLIDYLSAAISKGPKRFWPSPLPSDYLQPDTAIHALEHVGAALLHHEKVLESLFKEARRGNQQVMKCFWQLGPELSRQEKALAVVFAAHEKCNNWVVKSSVLLALGQLGPELLRHEKALAIVLKHIEGKDKLGAIQTLGHLGPELACHDEILITVLNALKDADKQTLTAAASALKKMGPELARQEKALAIILKAAADESQPGIREVGLKVLGQLGQELIHNPNCFKIILATVNDQDASIRKLAVQALKKLGIGLSREKQALGAILKSAEDQDASVRLAAIQAIGQLGQELLHQPTALQLILAAVKDMTLFPPHGGFRIRKAAIEALGKIGLAMMHHEQILNTVIEATNDDLGAQHEAVTALKQLGPELWQHEQALIAVLQAGDEESSMLLDPLLQQLGEKLSSQEQALAITLKATHHPDEKVRQSAILLLGQLGPELPHKKVAFAAVLKAAADPNKYIKAAALGSLQQLGPALAQQEEALAVALKALRNRDWEIQGIAIYILAVSMKQDLIHQKTAFLSLINAVNSKHVGPRKFAVDILKRHWIIYMRSAIEYYLSTEATSSLRDVVVKKLWTGYPWFNGIVSAFSWDAIPFSATLSMDKHRLVIQSGLEKEELAFTSPLALKPLIEKISNAYFKKWQLPLPNYQACVGEIVFYPDAKSPVFQASTWPEPSPLPSISEVLPIRCKPDKGIRGLIDSKLNPSQSLQQPLKPSPPSEPEIGVLTSPTEVKLHQQVMFLQQRHLLATFLNDVQKMLQQMAKLYLHDLPIEQYRSLVEPQVFLSYAWEAVGTRRLKQLQEVFLRDTLAKDLRHAGLLPWLDIEKMVGDMDGQMRDNVMDSQFVLLLGTQRYAERTKIEKCGLLHLPPGSFKDSVEGLPIAYNTFYLRTADQLFYVSDKAKNQYKMIELMHEDDLVLFDRDLKLSSTIAKPKAKQLTTEELATIRRITRHERRTNVRKELEFTLAEAKKSNDFLLPLLLEGDWGTTFPEISKEYLIFDSRTWFSLEQGWLSFEQYIHGLTQLSPLGILPTVLGMSRTKDYPDYRKACRKAYENLYRNLQLELRQLLLSPLDDKSRMRHESRSSRPINLEEKRPMATDSFAEGGSHTSISTSQSVIASITCTSSTTHSMEDNPTPEEKKNRSFSFSGTKHHLGLFLSKHDFSDPISRISSKNWQSLKQIVQQLYEEQGYTFTCKLLQTDQLQLTFTGFEIVSAFIDKNKIQKQLAILTQSLKRYLEEEGVSLDAIQLTPNLKTWSLTIQAESSIIEQLKQLLQSLGLVSGTDADVEICKMQ